MTKTVQFRPLIVPKKIKITDKGIYVLDPEWQASIKKTKLSPSMIGSWLASPADYILNKYMAPLVQEVNPIYFDRGTAFHGIMETFFKLPKEERTEETLKKITKSYTIKNFPHLIKDVDGRNWFKTAIDNYLEMGFDYNKEKIANLYVMGNNKDGIELFVTGKVGEITRPIVGYIDKILETETGLMIEDWKTGKSVASYNPDLPTSDSNNFDYWRQQTLYAMLLEKYNFTVSGARLTFPMAKKVVVVDHNRDSVRKQVIQECEQVDRELTESINNMFFFPFKKGKYNGWSSWLGNLGSAKKPDIKEDIFLSYVTRQ